MRLLKSFKFAFRGIGLAIRGQMNMRIHLLGAVAILLAGFSLEFSYTEWCMVILCIGLVMGMEVMNTAIEELVNWVSPERKKEAGMIKDLAAGAVLIVALAAAVVGFILIFSKLF